MTGQPARQRTVPRRVVGRCRPRWRRDRCDRYGDGEASNCVEWAPTRARAHGAVPIRDSKTCTHRT
ncbi:DUF397 domain-containing protein [Streptomyces sp. NPDC091292]|uniref:DUF397 domain-containing protein n=1 Tax=Streptomyces sp. NPDC091292 TaxID=3365991 RepID=UPI0038204001